MIALNPSSNAILRPDGQHQVFDAVLSFNVLLPSFVTLGFLSAVLALVNANEYGGRRGSGISPPVSLSTVGFHLMLNVPANDVQGNSTNDEPGIEAEPESTYSAQAGAGMTRQGFLLMMDTCFFKRTVRCGC